MHGRKKSTVPPSQKEVEGIKKKIATYNSLVGIVFDRRRSGDKSPETLDLTGKLLSSFPDFYSMWNFRREILIEQYGESIGLTCEPKEVKISLEGGKAVVDVELALSQECIKKNPKSYCGWHHRKWILGLFDIDYEAEFNLCKEFLKLDQRNFHCWNYRRFVASVSGIPDISTMECRFSDDKIKENFSNYSAFHHRSVYLFDQIESGSSSSSAAAATSDTSSPKFSSLTVEQLLESEFDIVLSAIFTEPDDQSAWWYHQFLLSNIARSSSIEFASSILEKQANQVEELLSIEPDCKLAKVALTSILEHYIRLNKEVGKSAEYKSNRREILTSLIESDKMHAKRYEYLLSLPI